MKPSETAKKTRRNSIVFLAFLGLNLLLLGGFLILRPNPMAQKQVMLYEPEANAGIGAEGSLAAADLQKPEPEAPTEPEIVRTELPPEVRGLYWTASTAGSARGETLLSYMKESGLNTVVMDVKMDNGQLAFVPNDPSMQKYVMTNPAIDDLDGLLRHLGEEGFYRIARVAVMRDGAMAVQNPGTALRWPGGSFWQDKIGSLWVDPAAPEVAEYALALGKELHERGFDEIQYDYVRFASDGSINSIRYPVWDGEKSKVDVMREFFAFVGGGLQEEGIPVSFDVFGMTFINTYDFNIGQRLQDVYPYADFVSPMVYPSHYADGFNGFANPALYPYEVVKVSLDDGAEIALETLFSSEEEEGAGDSKEIRRKFRPWLQDFDIGAVYTAARIEAQIKAARDAGASGWILWNARNVYEPADYVGE